MRKEIDDVFCPQCAQNQPDDLNYCKSCGANLGAVRTALVAGTSDKFDWNKTWLAEMMMSSEEKTRRAAKLAKVPDAEMIRRNELKAGVITASAGFGLLIALYAIMQGIIASGAVSDAAIAILSRVWIVGFIPLFVGFALIINGTFISRKGSDIAATDDNAVLPPAETHQLTPRVPFSVTDDTTRHLDAIPIGKKTAEIPPER